MKFDIDDGCGQEAKPSGIATQIIKLCDSMEDGKLLTVNSVAERLGVRKSTADHSNRELVGYTILRKVNGRWRRLFGNRKTIAALAKEDSHAK